MGLFASRAQRRALDKRNKLLQPFLLEIPRAEWPSANQPASLQRVWRSSGFLVQLHVEEGVPPRLSINRSSLGGNGRWKDGITWDDMQRLKREAGFGARFAVEIFPADVDLVDVANVRHIWLLAEPPHFAWRRGQ